MGLVTNSEVGVAVADIGVVVHVLRQLIDGLHEGSDLIEIESTESEFNRAIEESPGAATGEPVEDLIEGQGLGGRRDLAHAKDHRTTMR
ncbi:MAG: hypothetical protein RL483_223 [Pseudomonadota bacterium]